MKILITGTHFTPAQAVIEDFKKDNSIKVVYVGRKYTREGDKSLSTESLVLPGLGIKFLPLVSGRLQRSFTAYTIPSLFKIPVGLIQAFYYLLREKPDVILSFGGYIAVPVVFAGWLLSVPVIIHEQTLVTGLANKISSWFATKIAVSFDHPFSFKESKIVLTGNPIRKEILKPSKKLAEEFSSILEIAKKKRLPLVLITGGNQGSQIINQVVLKSLEEITKFACIIHQTGDSKFNDFEKLTEKGSQLKNSQRYLAKKWINGEDLGLILRNTSLVVSRAGANTLLELAYLKIPALVVPIPYVSGDEQNVNAKFFEKNGLVLILSQSKLSSETFISQLRGMVKDIDKLKEQANLFPDFVIPDAGQRVALETLLIAKK